MKLTGMAFSLLSLGGILLVAPAAAAGDADRGKTVFARCAACHSMEPAGKNKMGPSLANVIGRKAGSIEGFAYSPAMKKYDKVWDADLIDDFLAAPKKTVPGTTMIVGVRDPRDRADLIAYLKAATK